MRYGMLLAIASLAASTNYLPAQERIPLPLPDPTPAGTGGGFMQDRVVIPPPSMLPAGGLQAVPPNPSNPSSPPSPPAPLTPPQGYYPAPAGNYPPPGGYPYPPPPPPGMYGPPPPYAPRIINGDPVRNPSFWIGVEDLLWWTKNQPLSVPVITTGPGSLGANAGALGAPGTTSLNGPLNFPVDSGIRIFAGGWFDADHRFGIDGSLFFLGRQGASFGAFDRSGTGAFVINEPVAGIPFSTLVSAPGVETGGVSVNASSTFWGADVNGRYNLLRNGNLAINLVGGFRFLELDESLNIGADSSLFTTTTYTDNLGNVLATAPPGSTVLVVDHFGTRNQFYGGQLGAQFQYNADRWFVNGTGKIALGSTQETVTVNGYTNVYPVNGPPAYFMGGNFATLQAGRYTASRFAVVPEFNINIGYQFTPFLRGMIGYNFIYLSSVARPGQQIDNTYDGAAHPLVPMTNSSFWTQGITFSLQFSF